MNRRRKIALALMVVCFGMICLAAKMLVGIKPAEHARGLLLMTWMLLCITGMIAGMVLLLAGKAPRRSVRQEVEEEERRRRESEEP
jgi:hypothetical protein